MSNDELLASIKHVEELIENAIKQRDSMRPGGSRDHRSRWIGCLEFNRLTLRGRAMELGLIKDPYEGDKK